jgi:hypothetical protein
MRKFTPTKNINVNTISFQDKLNMDMNKCIEKMEERHQIFIEAYGEDNYERDYNIENYNEMAYNYDDDYDSDFASDEDY